MKMDKKMEKKMMPKDKKMPAYKKGGMVKKTAKGMGAAKRGGSYSC